MKNLCAGICPSCKEHLLIKKGIPFLVCPLCSDSISAREAEATLEVVCEDPQKLSENIAKVIKLERLYGPELPHYVLIVLAEKFPNNEDVAYLLVKMSDYHQFNVRKYLTTFAGSRKAVTFAEDFLDKTLTYRNMAMADMFEQYIKNKVTGNNRDKWLEKLDEMRKNFRPEGIEGRNMTYLYTVYIASTVINLALCMLFLLINIDFILSAIIAIAILFVQVTLIYLHGRKYGDRVEISETERFFVVAFMCSLVIVVGGMFLGAFITL